MEFGESRSHSGPRAEGPSAPPRRNGELIFSAPWESRAFGMAVALPDKGVYEWDAFTAKLAETLATSNGSGASGPVLHVDPEEPAGYYLAWLAALEDLLVERGVLARGEVDASAAAQMDDHHV